MTKRSVTVSEAASKDIARLERETPGLGVRSRALLTLIEAGRLSGDPLKLLASYGDLSDCRKIYFSLRGTGATHRLVYQVLQAGGQTVIEVVSVVAVESRDEGYVYLLAANRLGRLPPETEPKLKRVRQQFIAKRARKK